VVSGTDALGVHRLRPRQPLRQSRQPGATDSTRANRISATETGDTANSSDAKDGPWLCNTGFDLHKTMAHDRLLQPQLAGRASSVDAALAQARRLLGEASRPALLVSAHASNEELDALQALPLQRFAVYTRQDRQPAPGEVVEDALLIRADKNPNTHGMQARFGSKPFDPAAGHDLAVVWGQMAGAQDWSALGDLRVIHLASFGPAHPAADVLLPISTHFERSGSFSNFEGTPTVFTQVFNKPDGVLHAGDVLRSLLA